MKEIWKAINEFPNYEVSTLGRVKNISTGKVLKPVLNNTGYYKVILCQNNKHYTKFIHRLVAIEFIPNPDELPEVNHIDECKANNGVSNLEWCTKEYNNNYGTRNKRIGMSHSKKVQCVETAEVFECTADAARKYGLERCAVSNASNPNHAQKTAAGYHWCYL